MRSVSSKSMKVISFDSYEFRAMHGFVYFLSKDKDKYPQKSDDAVFDLQLAENKKLDLVTIQDCKKKPLIGSIHLFYILFSHGITHFNTNRKTRNNALPINRKSR